MVKLVEVFEPVGDELERRVFVSQIFGVVFLSAHHSPPACAGRSPPAHNPKSKKFEHDGNSLSQLKKPPVESGRVGGFFNERLAGGQDIGHLGPRLNGCDVAEQGILTSVRLRPVRLEEDAGADGRHERVQRRQITADELVDAVLAAERPALVLCLVGVEAFATDDAELDEVMMAEPPQHLGRCVDVAAHEHVNVQRGRVAGEADQGRDRVIELFQFKEPLA